MMTSPADVAATDGAGPPSPATRPAGDAPAVVVPRPMSVDDIVIGAGVVSTGHFVTGGVMCIDGKLRDSQLEADVLSISAGAELEGRARARQVEVFGRINGELVATEQLVLRASAHVTGRISSPCMVMHRGAVVIGEVETVGFDAGGGMAGSGDKAVAGDTNSPD